MSVNGCSGKRIQIKTRPDSKSSYIIRRTFDESKVFTGLECCLPCDKEDKAGCNKEGLNCEKDIPMQIDFLIGLFPARHNLLIKCCHNENLLDRTVPDK
jgi:hypothetical protein